MIVQLEAVVAGPLRLLLVEVPAPAVEPVLPRAVEGRVGQPTGLDVDDSALVFASVTYHADDFERSVDGRLGSPGGVEAELKLP